MVATISSPLPTIQTIIDSVTQPWLLSQLYGNKYFTNPEQPSSATRSHTDKTIPLTVTNSHRIVDEQNNDVSIHVNSSKELILTQIPQPVAIPSAADSASERHKSKLSTAATASSNIHMGKKQLIISRVSTHSETPSLVPSQKLNKIFDTFSAASKHHYHDHR